MPRSDRTAQAAAHRNGRGGLVAIAVLLAMVTIGCSDDDEATPSTTTTEQERSSTTTEATGSTSTTTTPTTTTSAPTPGGEATEEDEIVARYVGYWDARFVANSGTPNPDDPALRDFATGAQLDAVVAETQANLEQGLALRQADDPLDYQRVDVIEIEGDRAVVQECVVDDLVVVRRDTGAVVNDAIATHNVRGELLKVDGVWRVSQARLVQRWEGVAGCAAAP